ncbi:MAG: superoxide dismutase [Bacteroidaceae bacterium]|nr:superoxide dismutase [Bacteroidaceae bacterium]
MKNFFANLMMAISCGTCYGQDAGTFELMKLPYAPDALEPHISRQTIELHHGKHLSTYVHNLNKMVAGTELANRRLPEIVASAQGALFNNAGQVLNHNLYFLQFSPNGGGTPTKEIADAIKRRWGNFEVFKKDFEEQCMRVFGSGWVWLAEDEEGELHIMQTVNAGNPVTRGMIPLLGFDVWEHAYYTDYQNRRADHIAALWNIVDWEVVNCRYVR